MNTINKINKGFLFVATTLSVFTTQAKEIQGHLKKLNNVQKVAAACDRPQASAELSVNNVRMLIFSGSDMWWDLFGNGNARYFIPKVPNNAQGISSNFAGNVWFGGIDDGGQLKVAAQTYRQDGNDFWTGPLSTVDGTTSNEICNKYDKFWKITRNEVESYVKGTGPLTQAIIDWPGNGDLSLNHDPVLAPYEDVDGSGSYNPEAGDYPAYDVYNTSAKNTLGNCKARVFGDETLWWVYNDNGDVHSNTGGKAIGMEVRAQAFGFKTTDEINNMTFYSYELINRSSFKLNNTYMTVWTDADLGCYQDDYIGCDVKRGLGFIYNADNFDENCGSNGYGSSVPALGCDFFQGPLADLNNGTDDDKDGVIDEQGEQMGMSKFLYHNNNLPGTLPQTTNPGSAVEYYNYMIGKWKDGTDFTCGGNAYGGSISTSFVFPATPSSGLTTDPANTCGNWNEILAGNTPTDRRFMQSSGPFTLLPGAVNYVTIGLPWARTNSTNQLASVDLLKIADDKAQALFDNCFQVLSGPDAPDMTIQELENELVLYFTNKPSSNNYLNQYKELDVTIVADTSHYSTLIDGVQKVDNFYRIEGFKVYQLLNDGVSVEELDNPSKAKLAFACDVDNGVKTLINYEYDASVAGDVPKVKAVGTDNGLKSSFRFTKDLFSSSPDQKVINHKTYYFMTVAYGYNQYGEYKEDTPWTIKNGASSEGQKKPYLQGRNSKKAFGIPHNPTPEKEGTMSQSVYGYGPKITRHEGQGNGGNYLDFTDETVNAILSSSTGMVEKVTYQNAAGPIGVKVVDPLNVPNAEFAVKFINKKYYSNADSAKKYACSYSLTDLVPQKNTSAGALLSDSVTWVLRNNSTGKEYVPCKSIKIGEEYYFSDLGLSINIGQVRDVAGKSIPAQSNDNQVLTTDVIGANMIFADQTKPWLTGVPDADGSGAFNWIRSGGFKSDPISNNDDHNLSGTFIDPDQVFEKVLGGTWAPYCLTAAAQPSIEAAPASPVSVSSGALQTNHDMRALASVDIVLTKDKSKWTRALILEQCDVQATNPTGARKLEPKRRKSVDINGNTLSSADVDTNNYSCGWFPGYAINLETGERLQIAFGEDSYQTANNGDDMMWNPTSNTMFPNTDYPYFNGRHYIYVFGHNRSNSRYLSVPASGGQNINGKLVGVGAYNEQNFKEMVATYKWAFKAGNQNVLRNFWSEAMWVNIPAVTESRFEFKNPADMPCDVKVKLRVKKAYRTRVASTISYNSNTFLNAIVASNLFNSLNTSSTSGINSLSTDSVSSPVNNNMPYYTFSTADIFAEINNADAHKSALDLINVVPNPYYGYSAYESNRLDNRVRITNLPNKCKIKIFTLNGTLVRTFDRDVSGQEDINITDKSDFVQSKRLPFQDWDLKNQSGISVASGLYIIHIDVPGVGEKILKWFGVMRPLDLQSY